MILAGDVGGTKCTLIWFTESAPDKGPAKGTGDAEPGLEPARQVLPEKPVQQIALGRRARAVDHSRIYDHQRRAARGDQ